MHLLHNNQRTLRQPTGQWLTISDWKWVYSPSENRIYQTTGVNYTSWTALPSRTRRKRFQRGEIITQRPHNIVPVTQSLQNPQLLILTGLGHLQNTPHITLNNHLLALASSDQWASAYHKITDDGYDLALRITQGTATAVSDGSYKNQYGASCSILRSPNRMKHVITLNAVPGLPEVQSAYRSELASISGSLHILQAICNHPQLTDGTITIGLARRQIRYGIRLQQQTPTPPTS